MEARLRQWFSSTSTDQPTQLWLQFVKVGDEIRQVVCRGDRFEPLQQVGDVDHCVVGTDDANPLIVERNDAHRTPSQRLNCQ